MVALRILIVDDNHCFATWLRDEVDALGHFGRIGVSASEFDSLNDAQAVFADLHLVRSHSRAGVAATAAKLEREAKQLVLLTALLETPEAKTPGLTVGDKLSEPSVLLRLISRRADEAPASARPRRPLELPLALSLVRHLLPIFRGECEDSLERIRRAAADGQPVRVAREAHRLRSALDPFEFQFASMWATEIEKLARASELEAVPRLIERLEREVRLCEATLVQASAQ